MADRRSRMIHEIRAIVRGAQEVEKLAQDYDRLDRETRKDFNDPTTRLRGGADRTRQSIFNLKNAVTALATGLVAREFVQATNQFRQLEGQLNTVTESQEETNEKFEDLRKIANRTFAPLDSTIKLYARLSRSTRELGDVTEDQVLQFTEVVNQAIAASGASRSEASAAVVQLTQGLAAGTFRAEEFNSIIEQTPRLAQAIADGLGVTLGQLREMLLAGELTSDRVFGAILNQTEEIESEFNSLPKRVDQALTQLGNDLTAAFGRADVDGLVDAVDNLRRIMTDPEFVDGITSIATAIAQMVGGLSILASGQRAFPLEDEIDEAQTRIEQLQRQLELGGRRTRSGSIIERSAEETAELREELEGAEKQLRDLKREQLEALTGGEEGEEGTSTPTGGVDVGGDGEDDDDDEDEERPSFGGPSALIGGASTPAGGPLRLAEAYRHLGGEIAKVRDESEETEDELSEFAIQAARNMESAFADFLFDPFEDGLEGLFDSFVLTLRRMAAEAAAAAILDSIFNSGSGGDTSGGANAGFAAFLNSVFSTAHSGGVVGQTSFPQRTANPLVFAGAQHFANGGLPGLGPNEVPIIAHRDEEILTASDPRHRDNLGRGGGGATFVQYITTPDAQSFRRSRAAQRRGARELMSKGGQ